MAITEEGIQALAESDVAVLVVPSRAVRSACEAAKKAGLAESIDTWVIASKGIEQETYLLLHQVVEDVLGTQAGSRVAVLSGPSHAEEVSRRMPTTVVACANDPQRAEAVQNWFFRPHLRVYTHNDMLGVELGGAIKNIIAIAAGIADGMGFGDNSRAALMTRGLAEIVRLGLAAGARLETFMGLSGIGDLIVTAGSRHSRNHQFGEFLAQGLSCEEALDQVGMVVEGYFTARAARQYANQFNVEMPIAEAVYTVLYEGKPPALALEELLAREPKPEHY